jgi:hypothetical protein
MALPLMASVSLCCVRANGHSSYQRNLRWLRTAVSNQLKQRIIHHSRRREVTARLRREGHEEKLLFLYVLCVSAVKNILGKLILPLFASFGIMRTLLS